MYTFIYKYSITQHYTVSHDLCHATRKAKYATVQLIVAVVNMVPTYTLICQNISNEQSSICT